MAYTSPFNDRIAYFNQAVFYKTAIGAGDPLTTTIADHLFLNGVQDVNVSREISLEEIPSYGQITQNTLKYGKTKYQIEITRVLSSMTDAPPRSGEGDFFYNTSGQSTYETAHIANITNGIGVGNGKLRYYDITVVYGRDEVSNIDGVFPPGEDPPATTGECRTITYRSAVLNSLSYDMGVDGSVTESISLTAEYYEQDLVTDPLLFEDLDPTATPVGIPLPRSGKTLSAKDIVLNPDVVPHTPANPNPLAWLPLEVQELFNLGTNKDGIPILGITSVNIDINFNIRELQEFGQWSGSDVYSSEAAQTAGTPDEEGETKINQYKILDFPVEVTCTFEGIVRDNYINSNTQTTSDANPSAIQPPITKFDHLVTDTHFSSYGTTNTGSDLYAYFAKQFQGNNKADREIRILAKDPVNNSNYWQWNLGSKNFLTDFSFSDGAVGGGNVTATLTYKNNNEVFLVKDSTIQEFSPSDTY